MPERASIFVFVLLSACTSYGITTADRPPIAPAGALPPGLAQICALRPHVTGALVPTIFRDNDRLVGATRGPSYFCWFAEPGSHAIVAIGGDDIDEELGTSTRDTATIDVVAARRYWLHQTVGQTLGVGSLQWVDEERAFEMIRDASYTMLDAVPGDEALPPRVPLVRAASASARP